MVSCWSLDPVLPSAHPLGIRLSGHRRDLVVPLAREPDERVRDDDRCDGAAGCGAPHSHARDVTLRLHPVVLDVVGVAIETGDNPDRIACRFTRPEDLALCPGRTRRMKQLRAPSGNPRTLANR